MIVIARHINYISLNSLEYLLQGSEPDSPVMKFNNTNDAKKYLSDNGCSTEEIDNCIFEEYVPSLDIPVGES